MRASRGRGDVPGSVSEVAGPEAIFVGARELVDVGSCEVDGCCVVVVWRLSGAEATSAMMTQVSLYNSREWI